ncbi:MAG: VTC domain-containing protein [Anaerolineales bacterium]|nr:VTC domain-containing protein [Anaerolineales bacterium]
MTEYSERNYRYERKYIVEQMEPAQVRALIMLHPALFTQPYPPRFINNIYLDTPDLKYYEENVSGVKDRRKVRIRWYGDLFGHAAKPTLELKIKDGLVGTKASYIFPAFTFDQAFSNSHYLRLVQDPALPPELSYLLRDHIPVLVNRYYRWYYATTDGHFRVTVDIGMTYFNIRSLHNPFSYRQKNRHNFVVELKYGIDQDKAANRIANIFPFSLTKNSKYIQGIEQVFH